MRCSVPDECPKGALELVHRCLARDPRQRVTAMQAVEIINRLAAVPMRQRQTRDCGVQRPQRGLDEGDEHPLEIPKRPAAVRSTVMADHRRAELAGHNMQQKRATK